MRIFQPIMSDEVMDVRAPFLVIAKSREEAEKAAREWFYRQEENVQKFFAPTPGKPVITEMDEIVPNSSGIIVLPGF